MDPSHLINVFKNCFITGTGTGIGKTYVTTRLIKALRQRGQRIAGFKPICCGDDEDVQAIYQACEGELLSEQINPILFAAPVSPFTASQIDEKVIDLERIDVTFQQLQKSFDGVIVEGAGGWKVPIRRDYFMSDLAKELGLPVVVVVGNQLGALNETLLTLESIRSSGCICAGYIINNLFGQDELATLTNPAILEDILEAPRLLTINAHQEAILL